MPVSASTSTSAMWSAPACTLNSRELRVLDFSSLEGSLESARKTTSTSDWSAAAASLAALTLLWKTGAGALVSAPMAACTNRSRSRSTVPTRSFRSSGTRNPLDVVFPLTPALSLKEREKLWQRIGQPGASSIFERRAVMLPLPEGEGRGEGEQAAPCARPFDLTECPGCPSGSAAGTAGGAFPKNLLQ